MNCLQLGVRRRISICISKPRLMRFWSSIIESSRADQPPPRCHWHFDKKVKLVMDLTILYLVSTKMLNFELSDYLDKWHKELSFSGELCSWPRQSEWVSVGCLVPYLVIVTVTPVLWRGSKFSNWNVTRPWWHKPVSRRKRVMTNCWSMTITGQWTWLVIVGLLNIERHWTSTRVLWFLSYLH